MQLYTALLICILLLSLTGGLAPFQSIFGLGRFKAAFFALSMLALSRFEWALSAETRVNLCAAALPLALALWARKEGGGVGAPGVALVFSLLAFGAEKAGIFAGGQSGLLTGFLAGASAVALAAKPKTALAVACAIPPMVALLSIAQGLLSGSYVVMDFSQIALRDAQMSGLCFAGVLLCMYAAARRAEGPAEGEPPKQQS